VIIIDPGADANLIIEYLKLHALIPACVINTHAHFDHIGAVNEILSLYQIPFYLHSGDFKLLKQANIYKAIFGETKSIKIPQPTFDLSTSPGTLKFGGVTVNLIFTPGHTKGSISFLIDGNLFSGDTILSSGVGRTDLPGGDRDEIILSIKSLAQILPQEFTIWPGHGAQFSCTPRDLLKMLS
jgi:hydroxyacylglutathione hydrolase